MILILNCRFFEIESKGLEDELRIHYSHDQHHYISTFRYRLADDKWHKLAVTLSGNHVTLYVDCLKLYEKIIQTVDRVPPQSSNIQLFVGQQNRQHALFRVSIGVVCNMKMYHVKRVGFLLSKTKIWSFFQRMKFINFFFDTSNLGDFKNFPPHKYTCIISQLSVCIDFVLTVQHELNYHGNFDFKDFWFLTSQIRMQPKLSATWNFMTKAVICCQRRKGKLLSFKKLSNPQTPINLQKL